MGVYQDVVREYLEEKISLPCGRETQTYITQIFVDITPEEDFSKESITLLYKEAIENYNFETFKLLGDWLFFTRSLFPNNLTAASPEYYSAVATSSYEHCYRILRGQWKLYEELANQFDLLTSVCHESFMTDSKFLVAQI